MDNVTLSKPQIVAYGASTCGAHENCFLIIPLRNQIFRLYFVFNAFVDNEE